MFFLEIQKKRFKPGFLGFLKEQKKLVFWFKPGFLMLLNHIYLLSTNKTFFSLKKNQA
jgi:hypothetical protein